MEVRLDSESVIAFKKQEAKRLVKLLEINFGDKKKFRFKIFKIY